MDQLWQDIRYALHAFSRSGSRVPILVALAMIALGIGATTTIFSVVEGVVVRSLPIRDADRLVNIFPMQRVIGGGGGGGTASRFAFELMRSQRDAFMETSGYVGGQPILTGLGNPDRISTWDVTTNLFSMLGARPLVGRTLVPDDDRPDAPRVVVLSYAFWSEHFGGNREIQSKTITLDGKRYQIVGVMPPEFRYPRLPIGFGQQKLDAWRPLEPELTESQRASRLPFGGYWTMARLAPGVTLEQAAARVDAAMKTMWSSEPGWNNVAAELTPAKELLVQDVRKQLWLVFGAVSLLLFIACANVANLVLARALGRQREIAIRLALGASRFRVARQLITESVLLSVLGGALGILLATWGVPVLLRLAGREIPRADEVTLNVTVLTVSVVLSALTGILFGLFPAIHIARSTTAAALREGSASTGVSGWRNRAGDTLVVMQVALTVILLAGAGVLAYSFFRLTHIETGFDTEHVLAAQFHLPSERYSSDALRLSFAQSALARMRALPGVTGAAVSTGIPLASGAFSSVSVPGRLTRTNAPMAYITAVTSDYFRIFDIPVVRGTTFSSDATVDPHGVVISLATARTFFPGETPIGKRIATYGDSNWVVIGVVGDVRQEKLDAQPPPNVYLPLRADPSGYLKVSIRTVADPASAAPSLRRAMGELDPGLPLDKLETMQMVVSESLQRQRFYASVLTVFAVIALVISTSGLFAVANYNVTRRMHELGIRVALGAAPGQILTLVIGRGLRLAGAGSIVGLAGAFAVTRVLRSLVYEVNTADPRIFATVALLLGCVAIVATYLPGRRGAMADPLTALRNE